MNRGLLLGVAVFLALLGIALVGSDSQALAGHGCGGCYGGVACDGAIACGGPVACCGAPVACCGAPVVCSGPVACGGPVVVACTGRRPLCAGGLFRHRRVVDCGCVGYAPVADCCGAVVTKGAIQKDGPVQKGSVQKDGPVQKGGAAQKEAAQKVTATAAPFVFYQMSYRR